MIEKQFEQTFYTFVNQNFEHSAQIPWNSHQSKILSILSKYTTQVAGLKEINLTIAWRAVELRQTSFLIGESNHMTSEEIRKKGIPTGDDGHFGKGIYMSQYPSYGYQYAEGLNHLLCSWVLMGKVYPVTESVVTEDPEKRIRAKNLKQPFDSHYALINRQGKPALPFSSSFFGEWFEISFPIRG